MFVKVGFLWMEVFCFLYIVLCCLWIGLYYGLHGYIWSFASVSFGVWKNWKVVLPFTSRQNMMDGRITFHFFHWKVHLVNGNLGKLMAIFLNQYIFLGFRSYTINQPEFSHNGCYQLVGDHASPCLVWLGVDTVQCLWNVVFFILCVNNCKTITLGQK